MSDIKNQIVSWTNEVAQTKINNGYTKNFSNLIAPVLDVSFGRKYAKIMSGTSVWGFVALSDDANKNMLVGDLLKPASWKTPAKHSRGNILDGTASFGMYGPSYIK